MATFRRVTLAAHIHRQGIVCLLLRLDSLSAEELTKRCACKDEAEASIPGGSVVPPHRADETVITGNPTERLQKTTIPGSLRR